MQRIKVDKIPLHVQAASLMRDAITGGAYEPGERLPSETTLAEQLGISRPTLREALLNLEREGLIIRRHGVGTFVAKAIRPQMESGIERMESVLQLAARHGMDVTVADLEVTTETPDGDILRKLDIDPGTEVTCVRRVLLIDGVRAVYMIDAVPSDLLAPNDIDESFRGSVLDLLRQKSNGTTITHAVADIVAITADTNLSRRLDVSRHQALLLLEESLFTESGHAIEYSRNYFVPDLFRFHVIRR